MSFSITTKNEVTTLKNSKSESLAELSGLIRNNGYVENNILYLTTENNNIAEMIKEILESLYEVKVKIKKVDNLNLFKNKLNLLEISSKVEFILQDIGYYDKNNNHLEIPPNYIVGSTEEIRAYLRGVFLCTGSINDPKTSYHMELTINKKEEAVFVQRLLNIFDLNAKILNRDKGYMIYIKEAEKISDYLKILNASKAVLYYENIRIYHEEKNKTNRLNNCEQANVDKIIHTASKQLEQIEKIERYMEIDLLDDKTKEVLTYRKKYPETSLKELSEIISLETGKTITKSGLNHRFRKIKDLAEKISKDIDH